MYKRTACNARLVLQYTRTEKEEEPEKKKEAG